MKKNLWLLAATITALTVQSPNMYSMMEGKTEEDMTAHHEQARKNLEEQQAREKKAVEAHFQNKKDIALREEGRAVTNRIMTDHSIRAERGLKNQAEKNLNIKKQVVDKLNQQHQQARQQLLDQQQAEREMTQSVADALNRFDTPEQSESSDEKNEIITTKDMKGALKTEAQKSIFQVFRDFINNLISGKQELFSDTQLVNKLQKAYSEPEDQKAFMDDLQSDPTFFQDLSDSERAKVENILKTSGIMKPNEILSSSNSNAHEA